VIEWQRSGNTIEYVHIIPADSDHSPTPNEVGVTADGHVWILITSPGGGTSLEWTNLDGQVLGIARHRFSSGRLIARLPDLEVILCGNESFNEKNAECASLPLDSDKPAWSLRLPNIGPGLGGFFLDGRLYLTTGSGSILAISLEPAVAGSESSEPEEAASDEEGLLWRYSFDQPLLGGFLPEIDAAGRAFAISESYRLYALDPDGSLRYQVDLPTGLFPIDPQEPIYGLVWPFVLPDGTVLVLSDQDTLYAVGPEGEISWESELEAPLAERPLLSKDGILYLVDTQGRLSAFDLNGQRWRFQSQAANRPASPAVAGPDGTVYFTVTDLSRGYVQAVSADGQDLWVTQAKTASFYEGLQVSQDGSLVFLKTDIFDARTGELLEYEPSVRVDEFVLGRDGGTYYRSQHSLIQWQFGPGGYEELQVTYWERPTSRNFFPHIQVDANQLYWVNYFETLMWIRPDGTVVNTFQPGLATGFDLENSRITLCDIPPGTGVMTCKAYVPESPEPVWLGQVGGVPDFEFWTVRHLDGHLYVLGEENTLYKYWIGEPGNP
jgi:outer membrane protein assembly factor BamB